MFKKLDLFCHIGQFKSGSTAIRYNINYNKSILQNNGFNVAIDESYKASHFLLKNKAAFVKKNYDSINKFLSTHEGVFKKPEISTNNLKDLYTSEYLFLSHYPEKIFNKRYKNKNVLMIIRHPVEVMSGLLSELILDPDITLEKAFAAIFSVNYDPINLIKAWKNFSDLTILPYPNFYMNDLERFLNNPIGFKQDNSKFNKSISIYVLTKLYLLKTYMQYEDWFLVYNEIINSDPIFNYTHHSSLLPMIVEYYTKYKDKYGEKLYSSYPEFLSLQKEFDLSDNLELSHINYVKFIKQLRIIFIKNSLIAKYDFNEIKEILVPA